jgi:hypothetical protein
MFKIVRTKKNHPKALVVIKNNDGPIPISFARGVVSSYQDLQGHFINGNLPNGEKAEKGTSIGLPSSSFVYSKGC